MKEIHRTIKKGVVSCISKSHNIKFSDSETWFNHANDEVSHGVKDKVNLGDTIELSIDEKNLYYDFEVVNSAKEDSSLNVNLKRMAFSNRDIDKIVHAMNVFSETHRVKFDKWIDREDAFYCVVYYE